MMTQEAWTAFIMICAGLVVIGMAWVWLEWRLDREENRMQQRHDAEVYGRNRRDAERPISDARIKKLWIIDDPDRKWDS